MGTNASPCRARLDLEDPQPTRGCFEAEQEALLRDWGPWTGIRTLDVKWVNPHRPRASVCRKSSF